MKLMKKLKLSKLSIILYQYFYYHSMDCRDIAARDICYVIGYFLQDEDVNPKYFPLIFNDFVELPDGTKAPPNKDTYELYDEDGVLIWKWKNDKPLVKPIDILSKNK